MKKARNDVNVVSHGEPGSVCDVSVAGDVGVRAAAGVGAGLLPAPLSPPPGHLALRIALHRLRGRLPRLACRGTWTNIYDYFERQSGYDASFLPQISAVGFLVQYCKGVNKMQQHNMNRNVHFIDFQLYFVTGCIISADLMMKNIFNHLSK